MLKKVKNILLYIPFLIVLGCSSGTSNPPTIDTVSYNTAVFDPATGDVPLPNILATATAADPLSGRAVNKPMNPLEALAYINLYEVSSTHAVSGMNSPIYIRFLKPVDPGTVTPSTIKVFKLDVDANSVTENSPLTFTDISGMFDYRYATGDTNLQLFPQFPLQPATRYMYVVTSGVKDAATGKSLTGSFSFEVLKATNTLPAGFEGLELIRNSTYADAGKTVVTLSGYAKVMNDLIAASTVTKISSRNDIALLGRFITTGAGFVSKDGTGSTASMMPVESALRAFAAGSTLPNGLTGKTWFNPTDLASNLNSITVTTPAGLTPAAYWAAAGAGTAPSKVKTVVTGTINSAELSIDPVVAKANAATINLSAVTGSYNPAAGVIQSYRNATGNLEGFYYKASTVPFVLITPTPDVATGKVVIFQHGISGQKEQIIAVAGSLTSAGYAVVAIDLPLHGELAVNGHTTADLWGTDFMNIAAPLAIRTNIQQAAFNLNRLEFTIATGGFAVLAADAPNYTTVKPTFVGHSLGSIVGAYYLAGNAEADITSATPYAQSMKGFLSVPAGRLAYMLQTSPTFSSLVNGGLALNGIATGTPTYHKFFQMVQSIIDPIDPATMTTPLAAPLPSRLSGRLAVQEAIGDQVIPNDNTRYFGNALGGRGVLAPMGYDIAPGFRQLAYQNGSETPTFSTSLRFMYTLTSGVPTPKVDFAAALNTTPTEGYFQFDQVGINHAFLLDPTNPNIVLAQKQMVYFLLRGAVVDPTKAL